MPKRVVASQMKQMWGEGTPNPIDPEVIRKEFAYMAEHVIQGGMVGDAGHIDEVIGLRLVLSYAISVEAPEATWAELQRKTVPDTAEVAPPKRPNRAERRQRIRPVKN